MDAPAKQLNEKQSLEIIQKENNERTLFVLDTSTPSIKSDVAFAERLKKLYPSSFVILVGTHPSACPEETLDYSLAVDAIAIGEYDCIINELADSLQAGTELQTVRGLCIRTEKGVIRTEKMPPMKDLDELPFASQFIKEYLDEKIIFCSGNLSVYPDIYRAWVSVSLQFLCLSTDHAWTCFSCSLCRECGC